MQCVIITQTTCSFPSPLPLTTLLHFQIFEKILSFLKNVLKVPLNLNIVVDKLFSCVGNSWRKESQAEENRYLIWAAEWSGEHNTSRHTEYTYYFLISNCSNASNFWGVNSALFLIPGINQKLTNQKRVIFYNPSNAPCSSDEFIQIKHFKHHSSIVMCSPFAWFNLQIMDLCLWGHIEC